MIRLSKQVLQKSMPSFQKSISSITLEQLHKNNPPFDIEIFFNKPPQKPPQKPDYEDEYKPNPDFNKDYYKD